MPDGVEDLMEWAVDNGGYIHEDLELVRDESGVSVRVRATRDAILPDTPLVSCPYHLAISYMNAAQRLPFLSRGVDFPEDFVQNTTAHTATVFFLCEHFLLGDRSFWWPYLRSIPQPTEPDKLGTPLWFAETNMKWLKETNLEKGCATREASWRKQYDDGIELLKDAGWNVERYSWTLALWAATILSSRSFTSSMLQEAIDGESQKEPKVMDSFPVLFPLVDLLNHQPMGKIKWMRRKGDMAIEAALEVQPGQTVYSNYGPKSNEELLLGYGFCIPANPFDQVAVRLQMKFSRRRLAIRETQSSYAKDDPDDVFYLRGPGHHDGGYPNLVPEFAAFPPALLDMLSIAVANEREVGLLESGAASLGSRHRIAMTRQLRSEIHQKLGALLRSDAGLATPQNQRQRHAMIYRDGQRDILQTTSARLEDRLKQAHSLDELLTIDAAVPLLDSLTTAKSFSAGLAVSLGTASIPELQAAGWESDVWVLWLAGLAISLHYHTLPPSPTHAWLASLVGAYGAALSPTPSHPDSPPEGQVGEIVQGLMPVIQDAASAGGVWARPEWADTSVLRWAARIILAESLEVDAGKRVICTEPLAGA
ncbi:MAG: hypothetical protein M1832_001198 [Thelocarpon impressellum]|nr:MAG: hypothetical protein M1832_001198 [Thelocarpon impressellum]